MKSLLQRIIKQAATIKPEYGEYHNHTTDPFTFGVNVFTTTEYTIGVPKELINDDKFINIEAEELCKRLIVKRKPN